MRRSLLAILLVVLVVPAVSGPASARHAQSFHHRYRFARQHVQPVRAENFAPGLYAYAPDAYTPALATRETNLRQNSLSRNDWGQNKWSQETGAKTASINPRRSTAWRRRRPAPTACRYRWSSASSSARAA